MEESEWKKNLRMNRDVFMILVNEVRPFLVPRRGPRGDDVLSVEKTIGYDFILSQGSGVYSYDC